MPLKNDGTDPLLTVACLLAVLAASPAAPSPASPEQPSQLPAIDYTVAETRYADLQADFEAGKRSEFELLDAYKVFYAHDAGLKQQLDRWVASTHSSYAYLARGIYYRKLGAARRGSDYIYKVPPENLAFMEQMFDLSKNDLTTSLRLNPRSYLSVLHLLNIAQVEGDDSAARRYLKLGNGLLPSNFLIRARYLIHLTPRWGGSYELMDEFIETCRSEGLPPAKIDLLTAIKLDDRGHAEQEKQQNELAHADYASALTLSDSGGARFRRDYLQAALQLCKEPRTAASAYCQ
jgi:Domain of unknown function (DUF4034)